MLIRPDIVDKLIPPVLVVGVNGAPTTDVRKELSAQLQIARTQLPLSQMQRDSIDKRTVVIGVDSSTDHEFLEVPGLINNPVGSILFVGGPESRPIIGSTTNYWLNIVGNHIPIVGTII